MMTDRRHGLKLPRIDIGNMDIKFPLDGLVLNVLYVKYGVFHRSMREHSHSLGSYELHYIPSGQGTLLANGARYPIEPGTLFMTGPNVMHEQMTNPSDPMAEYCIFFEVLSTATKPADARYTGDSSSTLADQLIGTPFWIGKDKESLMPLFELLAGELANKSLGFHRIATSILEMIVIRAIRQYETHPSLEDAVPTKNLDDSRLLTIEDSFLYEYASISLQQLADKLGLSTRQTERMVHKQYGVSFQEKKRQSRMSAAAELLAATDMPIGSIAERVGFATHKRFSQSFKQQYGMTASLYRSLGKR
ncbi:AraC family transcriptional regulator [Paenibacillus sp. 1P07SE]|uniref:helix-turn-helix transcriptional regulator n=1 Tax=Paenibacillus sp. 1P07SE TaxID=3132209 RepID=UPI0039A5EE17